MTFTNTTGERTLGDGISMINGNKSFTLVELLVVTVIIGILISMLLHSLSKAKRAAQLAECHNFRRQLVIYYYADDWDEGENELYPSYTKSELMNSYPKIKNSCYDCHASAAD